MTPTGSVPEIWSARQDDVWRICRRRYYYEYVEPSRTPGASPPLSLHDWLERVVHDAAASAVRGLRRKEPVSLRRLTQALERRMRAEWKANGDHRPGRPLPMVQWDGRHAPALELHPESLTSSLDPLLATASRCLGTLYNSPELEHLARFPERIQTIGKTKHVSIGDVRFELQVDVECLEPNGDVVFIDWRLDQDRASPPESRSRRGILAWFAMKLYGIDEVSVIEHELLAETRSLERVTLAAADEARWELGQRIRSMQRAMELAQALRAEAFDWTPDHSPCGTCPFRKRCPAGRVR